MRGVRCLQPDETGQLGAFETGEQREQHSQRDPLQPLALLSLARLLADAERVDRLRQDAQADDERNGLARADRGPDLVARAAGRVAGAELEEREQAADGG